MKFNFEKLKRFFIESDPEEISEDTVAQEEVLDEEVEAQPDVMPEPEPEPENDPILVTLSEFRACTDVAARLVERTPVFLDLCNVDFAIAKRALDFLGGVIFALQGTLQQVGDSVFYLTASPAAKDGVALQATYRFLIGK